MLESLDGVLGVDFRRSVARRTDVGTRLRRIAPPDDELSLAADLAVFLESSPELPQGEGRGLRGDICEIACGTIGAARLRERPLPLLIDNLRPSDPEWENSDSRRDLTGLKNMKGKIREMNNCRLFERSVPVAYKARRRPDTGSLAPRTSFRRQ